MVRFRFSFAVFMQYALLMIAGFVILFPPYVVFLSAFKGTEEYYSSGIFDWPDSFLNFGNFRMVLERGDFLAAFTNTGIILAVSLTGFVLMGTMIAYVLGRFRFPGRNWILGAYIFATVIPMVTTQVATFKIIQTLGLFNTYFAPTLIYVGADVVTIYIFLQFVEKIPYELDESAMMEGASLFKIYRTIIFPLLAPATATVVILKTIHIYNDMYIPYLYMPSQKLGVVSTQLMRFQGVNSAKWELLSAAIVLIILPMVVLFLLLQRYVFSGITSGAVK